MCSDGFILERRALLGEVFLDAVDVDGVPAADVWSIRDRNMRNLRISVLKFRGRSHGNRPPQSHVVEQRVTGLALYIVASVLANGSSRGSKEYAVGQLQTVRKGLRQAKRPRAEASLEVERGSQHSEQSTSGLDEPTLLRSTNMPDRFFEADELLMRSVLDWSFRRIVAGQDPQTGARPASELEPQLIDSISAHGIGGHEALRRFTQVIVPATRAQDSPMNLERSRLLVAFGVLDPRRQRTIRNP